MVDRGGVLLSELTTLRTGGPTAHASSAETLEDLIEAVRAADASARDLLLIGDGSNLVAPDAGWPGEVVLIRTRGIENADQDGEVHVRVEAGEPWDEFVARSVQAGWSGLECLSGIPGRTGATPVQNVNAYGSDVADSIAGVEIFDRDSGHQTTLSAAACRFGYRDSRFKHTERFVVLAVRFRLRRSRESVPIRYAELATSLGVALGDRAPADAVRAAVLDLRRSKGMVLDPADHDTWSVGSFFTNPILTPAEYVTFAERAQARLRASPAPGSGSAAWPTPRLPRCWVRMSMQYGSSSTIRWSPRPAPRYAAAA